MKKLALIIFLIVSMVFLSSCTSRVEDSQENITGKELENLPKDQKESQIDKKVAKIRKGRKESVKEENGGTVKSSRKDFDLETVGNIPDFTREDNFQEIFQVAYDYIENVLKIPKRGIGEYEMSLCIDPRINALYEDSDKGYLEGYENENIAIIEYESEKEGEYKYLFLVRESKKDNWKVLHNGNTYKKK